MMKGRNKLEDLLCFLLVAIVISCCAVKETKIQPRKRFVFEHAQLLQKAQIEILNTFLDSIRLANDIDLVYYAIENRSHVSNIDSLAESYFTQLNLEENGALIFVSKQTKNVKILVGKKIHSRVSNDELTQITNEIMGLFKQEKFYLGLREGFSKIASKVKVK